MQIKEIIQKLNDQGIRITAPFDDPHVRRIDGEFVMDNKVFVFKAYSIGGVKTMIRIDIVERD